MGNRDINKLRIVEELGVWSNCQKKPLPLHDGVYWLRGTNAIGDPGQTNAKVSGVRTERLKWMLEKTMGSVDAFELRRRELGRECAAIAKSVCASPARSSDVTVAPVTDDEVTESYMLSCDPNDGVMNQYLIRAKLIIKFGPALFMHGALPFQPNDDNDMKFPTPWLNATSEKEPNCNTALEDWIQTINHFAADQVTAWQEYGLRVKQTDDMQQNGVWATKGGYSNNALEGKSFGNLLQYGMNTLPDKTKNPSVVYSSWMRDGMPRDDIAHPFWSEFLTLHGLQVIASGHQPVGDMPWPIQICPKDDSQAKSSWILPCDTSFSADTNWVHEDGSSNVSAKIGRGSGHSGRGDVAVCETLIKICPASNTTNSVTLHGYLSDGTRYESHNLFDREAVALGKPIDTKPLQFSQGNEKKEGVFWSKVNILATKNYHLASSGKGFNVWNAFLTPQRSTNAIFVGVNKKAKHMQVENK
ncbi:hypothetical protein ACHAXN_012051 [Cyclotella atomus]